MPPATAANGWVKTLESDHPDVLPKAHHIMASLHYCTLSTCSADGLPWVSPVFFADDANWHLYWSSTIAAQHSQKLYHNQGRAAIAIYDSSVSEGSGKGLYLSGSAAEVEPPLVGSIMKLLFQRAGKHPDRSPQDYLGTSPRRIYGFQPQAAWISGERLVIGKQLVDTKIRLSLSTVLGQPV
jgi:hypothetical protein